MYIISKKSEKDYYDGVAGTTGIDKTIVYTRQIIELDKDKIPDQFKKRSFYENFREREKSPFYRLSHASITNEYHQKYPRNAYFIIGFCGKLYIGWKFFSFKKNCSSYDNVDTFITYDLEQIKEMLDKMSWHGSVEEHINYVLNFDAMQWFRDMNAPCFIYDYDYKRTHLDEKYWRNDNVTKFIINPVLKDYEFYKVFDSFQAFQEISMFIGGVLGNREKNIVEVADKYKIAQHGFDKWSFRKEPKNKQ